MSAHPPAATETESVAADLVALRRNCGDQARCGHRGTGPGALGENRAELLAALACLARVVLTGGFVVARAQAGPGGQVRRGGEPDHLDADLRDDHLSGALTDPRNRRQQLDLSSEREAGL